MNPGTDPLAQLRDIHLPPPVGWWPPAPGWWLLAGALLAALLALGWWLLRYRRARRYRRLALRELQRLQTQWRERHDDAAFAVAVNQLLKRTALAAYPRSEVAALNGADWLSFLDSRLRRPRFTDPDLRALATLYQSAPQPIAMQPLLDATELWIRSHRC